MRRRRIEEQEEIGGQGRSAGRGDCGGQGRSAERGDRQTGEIGGEALKAAPVVGGGQRAVERAEPPATPADKNKGWRRRTEEAVSR